MSLEFGIGIGECGCERTASAMTALISGGATGPVGAPCSAVARNNTETNMITMEQSAFYSG